MRNKNNIKLFDWVFIILNITFYLSIIKVFTFDLIPTPPNITLFAFNLFSFMFNWKANMSFVTEIGKSVLLILLFLIYTFDVIQNIFINPESAVSRFFMLLSMLLFCAYLYNLIGKNKKYLTNVFLIIKPYLLYSSYNVFIIILAGVLITMGILSPTSNMMSINSLTKVDVGSGQTYFFPGYISIVTESSRVLANWGIPMITGLSHEPHVVNYIILPSLFLLISNERTQKWRILIYATYVVVLFFAYSTTAIACLGFVLLIDSLWLFSLKRSFSSIIPLFIIVLIVIFGFGGTFYNLIVDEFIRKTITSTSSMEYSSAMIYYLTHPNSLFGTGNMPGAIVEISSKDVGAITFLLDISFYGILIFSILKIVISKNKQAHYLGLACLYVALHSLKVNFMAFNYPYFVFVVFIVSYVGNRLKYNYQ